MILKDLAELNRVSFHEKFDNWEDAIFAASQPLIDEGAIEPIYVEAMIESVKKYGPYIVLAPHIAMPHSQEGAAGVNKTAICFMKVEQPVSFEEGDDEKDAELFFVLASENNEQHMKNMQDLVEVLSIDDFTEKMLLVKNVEDLLALDKEFAAQLEG